MSRRTERSYKADGTGKLAPHSQARCSVPEVNDPGGTGRVHVLTQGDLCPGHEGQLSGAADREIRRDGTEVSRGHSSSAPSERRRELVGSVSTPSSLPATSRPVGRV